MTTGDARQFGFVLAATGDLEPDGADETRDSDGTPVGEADLEADKERSGAEHEHHHRHDV